LGKSQRTKGASGERELARILSEILGIQLQRGIQYRSGGKEAGDVQGWEGVHIEVKRTEKLQLWQALTQASDDAQNGDVPLVCHRPSRKPWIAIFPLDRLGDLAAAYVAATNGIEDWKSAAGSDKNAGGCLTTLALEEAQEGEQDDISGTLDFDMID
jgi:hypothetical protein